MLLPGQQNRGSQLQSAHKKQQLDNHPKVKTAVGELRSPLQQLQQHNEAKQPENNYTKKGKGQQEQCHFAYSISSPRPTLLSVKKELPGQKEFSLKENRGEWGTSFLSLSGHCTKDLAPTPCTPAARPCVTMLLHTIDPNTCRQPLLLCVPMASSCSYISACQWAQPSKAACYLEPVPTPLTDLHHSIHLQIAPVVQPWMHLAWTPVTGHHLHLAASTTQVHTNNPVPTAAHTPTWPQPLPLVKTLDKVCVSVASPCHHTGTCSQVHSWTCTHLSPATTTTCLGPLSLKTPNSLCSQSGTSTALVKNPIANVTDVSFLSQLDTSTCCILTYSWNFHFSLCHLFLNICFIYLDAPVLGI